MNNGIQSQLSLIAVIEAAINPYCVANAEKASSLKSSRTMSVFCPLTSLIFWKFLTGEAHRSQ
ncbi:hypothetical protein [Rhizobium sp. 11_C7_N12_5]|uniref:hypothetical protein n=1 Tax=Rhizobium sp. 11_C7_N12_5 TaxID=3240770 RepID=UPI003F245553